MDSNSFMPQGSNPQSSAFTCNTCGIKFVAADLQRQHMKTDWHRYNLKRRVAQLPSISSDVFAHKILQQQRLAQLQDEVDEFGFVIKTRKTKNQLAERGRTALLKQQEITRDSSPANSIRSGFSEFSLGGDSVTYDSESNFETGSELNFTASDSDITDLESAAEDEDIVTESETESIDEFVQVLPITYCFYCGINNHEIESNLKHMFSRHGLYIPERSYLKDLEGLLTFINEVITIDHECLVCGFLGKNLESIRQHMSSKGHCTLPYETDLDKEVISEFYDFDTTDNTPKSHSSKSVSFRDSDDQVIVHSSTNQTVYSNNTKVLPSGLEIGHRSSFKYSHPPASLVRTARDSQRSVALVDRRYAPGLSFRTLTTQERTSKRIEYKAKKSEMRRLTSKKNNTIAHFRDELLQ